MMIKTFRTTMWLFGIAMMSLALAGQPVLAGSSSSPKILSVAVDVDQLTITGTGFMPYSTDPSASLAGETLTVLSADDTEIVAECPLDTAAVPSPFCADGEFLLKVTTVKYDDGDYENKRSVAYDLTIGPTGFVTDDELATEKAERVLGDRTLAGLITAEETARISGDTRLNNKIDTEIADRTAADVTEKAQRVFGDRTLAGLITAEETARIAADGVLQGQIDDLVAEVVALKARVAKLEAKKFRRYDD